MKQLSHAKTRRAVVSLFTAGRMPRQMAAIYAHLRDCSTCASLFRRYQTLESRLGGPGRMPSVFAVERAEAALMDRLLPPAAVTFPRRPLALAGAVGTVALAAVALWILVPTPPSSDRMILPPGASLSQVAIDSEYTSRGAEVLPASAVGVRMLRVLESGEAPSAHEAAHLSLDDVITFTYTSMTPDAAYLTLFGLQEDRAVRWYYPGYDGQTSIPIEPGRVDEPLGDGIRLEVNHVEGLLQVVALFTARPLATVEIEEAVQRMADTGRPADELAELVAEPVAEHRLTVRIRAPHRP